MLDRWVLLRRERMLITSIPEVYRLTGMFQETKITPTATEFCPETTKKIGGKIKEFDMACFWLPFVNWRML
jgi:hypothetical protein